MAKPARRTASVRSKPKVPAPATPAPAGATRDAFLLALGDRLRTLRARRGYTRKGLASEARVSERHLANLETGVGNASILVLRQIAHALDCPLAELTGDETTGTPEWLLIRGLLHGRSEGELQRARDAIANVFAPSGPDPARRRRVALVGLRGAGKSTLGHMLAEDLGFPFVELNREIERIAGAGLAEIHALYGLTAYRRYERRALEETIALYPQAVIATPGGLVAEAGTLQLLLGHCFTVWLTAAPEDHMQRVVAQGDLRPMSGNAEAMEDLKRILAGRTPFYEKADLVFGTSGLDLAQAFAGLRARVREALGLPSAG